MISHKYLLIQKSVQKVNTSDTSNNLKSNITTDTRRTNSNQYQNSNAQTTTNQGFINLANQIIMIVHYENQQIKFPIDPSKTTRMIGQNIINKPLDIFSGQTINLLPFFGTPQTSKVSLKDFIFVKCIDVGGFSRVYMVKKKSNGRFQ